MQHGNKLTGYPRSITVNEKWPDLDLSCEPATSILLAMEPRRDKERVNHSQLQPSRVSFDAYANAASRANNTVS